MVGSADDGHLVSLAGSPGNNRLGLLVIALEELVVALAREVGATGRERGRHGVVLIGRELVVLGAQRGRVLHLHMSRGKADKGRGYDREALHIGDSLKEEREKRS